MRGGWYVKSDLIDLELYYVAETEKALGVSDKPNGKGLTVWLPLSQIEWEMKDIKKRTVVVTLPEWLAIEKELV